MINYENCIKKGNEKININKQGFVNKFFEKK
jgi:hypothetical protein